jgi:putative ABC transport system permease protein
MNSMTLVKLAARSIRKNKMRSLLTMLGIIIGVGAVLVMVAIGLGARNQIASQINRLGTNLIVITPGAATTGGVSGGAGTFNRLSMGDWEKLKNEALTISGVSPVVITRTQAIGGAGNWRTQINGVTADYTLIRDWKVTSGAFFNDTDIRQMRKVAVLGATVAKQLYPGEDPVGQQIRLRDVPFQIIGVLEEKGQSATGTDQDDVVIAPYTTVQSRLSGWSFIAQILASTSAPSDIPAAQEEMRLILRESHRLASYDEDDFTIRNQTDLADAAQGTTEVMSMLLAAIASISLLVGGIGIMNIMLVSVTERTREIGIRMAIGARGGDVLTQFLVEAIVMSLLGGAIGVLVGYVSTRILSNATGWSTAISPGTVVVALVFSAAVGIFFGFYPARKAAALNPIEALRYE